MMNSLPCVVMPRAIEILAAGDQVLPGVVLVGVLAGQAPGLAQFAAAAHMADAVGDAFAS